MTTVICTQIRKVRGGYIAELRWPHGDCPGAYGEVIFKTWREVLVALSVAADLGENKEVELLVEELGGLDHDRRP